MTRHSFFVERKKGFIAYEFLEPFEEGHVIDRPNRFIVNVRIEGRDRICHLHDPGRLKELIFPGNKIIIREKKGNRTDCSVVAAMEKERYVVIDSRIHSDIASKFLRNDALKEVKIDKHRLDFKVNNTYIEVKGCTLVRNHRAMFPDAPTLRGQKHLELLRELMKDGMEGALVMLVLGNEPECFVPNNETDPVFSNLMLKALSEGMKLKILSFHLSGRKILFDRELRLCKDLDSKERA